MDNQIVAIVGRPNVGKSTLFNRLTGSRKAIEDHTAGVTRDRLYGITNWRGKDITVIDTGGMTFREDIPIDKQVQRQVDIAIEEAGVIIFVLDSVEGITHLDQEVAHYLRRTGKKTLLVANKMDHGKKDWQWYPFYELGLGEPLPVSASHGLGTGDLLDRILEELPDEILIPDDDDSIKVAVLGRPNVGKSSLINKLSGEKDRVIVHNEPGTTRDAIDVSIVYEDTKFLLVDTAGVRRRTKVKEDVEYYSVLRSLKAAKRADVVLVILDASEGFTEQDQRIAGIAHEAGKGLIFIVNKWDLVSAKEEDLSVQYRKKVSEVFSFAQYAPVLITSALTGRGINKLFSVIKKVEEECSKRISTGLLNELLGDAVIVNPPPSKKGQKAKLLYMTQPEIKPPTFILFVNDSKLVHFSYLRYLENRLREAFGFEGVSVKIRLKQKKEKR